MKNMRLIIVFYCLLSNGILTENGFNCHLPDGCRLEKGYLQENLDTNEIGKRLKNMITCDINNDEFTFRFKDPPFFSSNRTCQIDDYHNNQIVFRWTSKELTILDRQFNFTNLFRYIKYMKYYTDVHLWNLNGFDLNFLYGKSFNHRSHIDKIQLSKCRLDFYHKKKKINSCEDILKADISSIMSIFQLRLANQSLNRYFVLRNVEYKQSICPLVFQNSNIPRLALIDLANTFYKRNVLSFTNETFSDLNSDITYLRLNKLENVNIDLKLLNPSVFNKTKLLYIESGSMISIDGDIFRTLKMLLYFHINPSIFRKINHKQGIEWIRQWNLEVNIHLSENQPRRYIESKRIILDTIYKTRQPLSSIFPDEDFCLYVDFPFNQFVILCENIDNKIDYKYKENEISCTYLWLVQYYEFYYKRLLIFKDINHSF